MGHPHGLDKLKAGNTGGACAIYADFNVFHFLAGQMQRIDKAGGANNRRAVLVVMKHGNVHQLAQLLLNNEAIGCLYVFQINAAKARAHIFDRIDNLLRVLCIKLQINGIDIGKAFEQNRLAFHDRLGGQRPQIAEPQNGRAIGNHCHHIAARRQII